MHIFLYEDKSVIDTNDNEKSKLILKLYNQTNNCKYYNFYCNREKQYLNNNKALMFFNF